MVVIVHNYYMVHFPAGQRLSYEPYYQTTGINGQEFSSSGSCFDQYLFVSNRNPYEFSESDSDSDDEEEDKKAKKKKKKKVGVYLVGCHLLQQLNYVDHSQGKTRARVVAS